MVVGLLWLGRGTKWVADRGHGRAAAGSAYLMAALYAPGGDPSRIYYGTDTRAQSLLVGARLGMLLSSKRASGWSLTNRTARTVLHGARSSPRPGSR